MVKSHEIQIIVYKNGVSGSLVGSVALREAVLYETLPHSEDLVGLGQRRKIARPNARLGNKVGNSVAI